MNSPVGQSSSALSQTVEVSRSRMRGGARASGRFARGRVGDLQRPVDPFIMATAARLRARTGAASFGARSPMALLGVVEPQPAS